MYSYVSASLQNFFILNNFRDGYSQILKFLYIIQYEMQGKHNLHKFLMAWNSLGVLFYAFLSPVTIKTEYPSSTVIYSCFLLIYIAKAIMSFQYKIERSQLQFSTSTKSEDSHTQHMNIIQFPWIKHSTNLDKTKYSKSCKLNSSSTV